MSTNLECQYDQVVEYISKYRTFLQGIGLRLATLPFKSPLKYLRLFRQFPGMWRQMNPLSGKNLDLNRTMVSDYATEEERTNEYFEIAVSDYPIDALSNALERRYNDVDFESLKKIHELRKTSLARFSVKQFTGFILAAATLVLKSIPKGVVENVFGYKYEDFEVRVFWMMTIVLAYLLIALFPTWLKFNKARSTHQYVGDILEYTAIKNKPR